MWLWVPQRVCRPRRKKHSTEVAKYRVVYERQRADEVRVFLRWGKVAKRFESSLGLLRWKLGGGKTVDGCDLERPYWCWWCVCWGFHDQWLVQNRSNTKGHNHIIKSNRRVSRKGSISTWEHLQDAICKVGERDEDHGDIELWCRDGWIRWARKAPSASLWETTRL